MTTVHECMVDHDCELLPLQQLLQQHVIVFHPPWSLPTLLQRFVSAQPRMLRRIQIEINHISRNVSVVAPPLSPPVLQPLPASSQSHPL